VNFLVGFDLFDPNRDEQSASFVLRTAGGLLVDRQTIPFVAPVASISISAASARLESGGKDLPVDGPCHIQGTPGSPPVTPKSAPGRPLQLPKNSPRSRG
jgi:hypothetical protein